MFIWDFVATTVLNEVLEWGYQQLVGLLGGFFAANPRRPGLYDIPLMRPCGEPESSCICGHARQVMYISAEGRALPCMALSGMELQNEFPLITELGLVYPDEDQIVTVPDEGNDYVRQVTDIDK